MEDEDNYTGIRYAIGDLSDNIRNEARYADVFDATLDPYEPSIALPGEGIKKKINRDPEVEIEAEIVSLIVKKMELGLRPYVHVTQMASGIEKFMDTDILPLDTSLPFVETVTIVWLHPRIYDKIKTKYSEVRSVLENLNRVQQETISSLNALEDSITNLKDKGHDFIL